MRLLSVSLDFEGRWALLIGAGVVGRRKLGALLEAGARVRVVEPRPASWLLDLAAEGLLLLEKVFLDSFLDDEPWVFVASEVDPEVANIVAMARQRKLWVNVASLPPHSNFFLPAVAKDEPFRLTVSTGGASPALAARVAKELKKTYAGYGNFCRLLARVRPLVLASELDEAQRRRIFANLAQDLSLVRLVNQGVEWAILERLEELLAPARLPADFVL
ncbi:MAG: hypothetical protein LBT86_05480 [Deltaproteobacteria bacterium]|jgi:siroheme synthase-like protein|nr:hypothetical protein [Deltaproteobacteria bacterium]